MNDLARVLLDQIADTAGARIVYGVATDTNTVALAGAATAVELPAISPVRSGDYCAVLVQGADRLIVGSVGGGSVDIPTPFTAASGWSINTQYARRQGNLLTFAVYAERTGGTITVPSTGNITNSQVATGSAAVRGSITWAQGVANTLNAGRVAAGGYVASTGVLTLGAVGGSGDIEDESLWSLGGVVFLD